MSDPRSTPAEPTQPVTPVTSPGATTPTGPPSTGPTSSPSGTAGQPTRSGRGGKTDKATDPLRHSRTSGLWLATIVAGLLLILLIIFIVQNTQDVRVRFLGWDGTPPLSVALLVATAAGILVTGLIGSLRIFQLRRRVKKADR